ncbi:MAG: CBS domain-containing protein [Sciscionella sp.]
MRIADVLRGKGSDVVTVTPDTTVDQLLAALAERNIGAVVVVDGQAVAGIVSERDVVRQLHANGPGVLAMSVSQIMSSPVVTCAPEDPLTQLMSIMTERRFRHLPVTQDGRLIGIISIGDVVKNRLAQLEDDRQQLESYIVQG